MKKNLKIKKIVKLLTKIDKNNHENQQTFRKIVEFVVKIGENIVSKSN